MTKRGVRSLFLDLYHTSGKFRLVTRPRPRRVPRASLLRRHVKEKEETNARADHSCNAGQRKSSWPSSTIENQCNTNKQDHLLLANVTQWFQDKLKLAHVVLNLFVLHMHCVALHCFKDKVILAHVTVSPLHCCAMALQ